MKTSIAPRTSLSVALSLFVAVGAVAQPGGDPFPGGPPRFDGPPPGFGGGQRGPGGGFGGFGGPMGGAELEVLKQFDRDGNKLLDLEERAAARKFVVEQRAGNSRDGRRGGPRFGREQEPPEPGETISPEDVKTYPDAAFYDTATLRTLFLTFENADWEGELTDFHNTDVEVPATLRVDGKVYRDVGVHFRGASSYFMVGEGRKKSLNLDLDMVHDDQNVGGYRTLNLLNANADASFIRTALFSKISGEYIPTPKANFVRVVINGENQGVYVNVEQFNKDFLRDNYGSTKGTRWKVPGSPRGGGGLTYLGEDPEDYKRLYEIKSKDKPEAWEKLIELTRVLNETPPDQLIEKLSPLLNIDGALKFLALDNALINNDGYWIRNSDFNLYLDENDRFHIVPHDMNETFSTPGGPGFGGGGQRVEGVALHPLVAENDESKPLISKLLAVPELKSRYLANVRDIAETWLDWSTLGPVAIAYHNLITAEVERDTKKLTGFAEFERSLTGEPETDEAEGARRGFAMGRGISIKSFADQRRDYLLGLTEVRAAGR